MISKRKMVGRLLLGMLALSVASSLVGANMDSGLPAVEVEDLADGNANDVLGHDDAGVAVSQSRDGARVSHDANQSISHNVTTKLSFNIEEYDDDTMHDTSTNNQRITIKTAGRYIVSANIKIAVSSVGDRLVFIRLNGSDLAIVSVLPASINHTNISISIIRNFSVNDFLEIRVYQNSTGSLNVLSDATSPFFAVQRLRGE